MTNRKVIEVLATKFVNPKLKQSVYTGLKEGNRKAQQYINSIFTEGLRDTTKAVVPTMMALGLSTQAAKAADNTESFKSKAAQAAREAANITDPVGHITTAVLTLLPMKIPGVDKIASGIATKAVKILNTKGSKAAGEFIDAATIKARNNLVKSNPKAKQQIDEGVMSVEEYLSKYADDNVLTLEEYLTKYVDDVSKAGDDFAKLIKQNGDALKVLADEVGVKSKKEIPNLLKFTRELGDIIQNAPNYIKAQATGDKLATIGNIGLSVYDLYQAYKANDNTLIPKTVPNASRIAAGFIPGNTIAKLLYGGLGYAVGDRLTNAAMKKLGVKEEFTDVEAKEIEQGIRHPGLSQQIPEYIQGQSGRKYHVVNDKIYDFSTGRPVNIQQAIQDVDAYVNFQTQQAQDQLNIINQQIADVEAAQRQGYNIPQENITQLYRQQDNLVANIQNLKQMSMNVMDDYDADGDLVEQYRVKEVEPRRIQEEAQQVQRQQDYQDVYKAVFDKIAQDTYADLENYYTPQNQAVDYFAYMRQVAAGQAPYMSPEEFSRYSKVQAMHQIAPQIQQQATNYMNTMLQGQQKQREYELALRKQREAERSAYTGDLISAYEAEEKARANRASEAIKQYEAGTGRMSAESQAMNAITNRMEVPIKQTSAEAAMKQANVQEQLLPYRQGSLMAETVNMASQSSLPLETFLNTNQSVMSQIFPQTQKQQDKQLQNINQFYNTQGQRLQ